MYLAIGFFYHRQKYYQGSNLCLHKVNVSLVEPYVRMIKNKFAGYTERIELIEKSSFRPLRRTIVPLERTGHRDDVLCCAVDNISQYSDTIPFLPLSSKAISDFVRFYRDNVEYISPTYSDVSEGLATRSRRAGFLNPQIFKHIPTNLTRTLARKVRRSVREIIAHPYVFACKWSDAAV